MATQKRSRKHDPDQDVYVLQDDEEPQTDDDPTIIETQVVMDWIEYNPEDEEENAPRKNPHCRVTFHVDLPEPIAQHLFAHHVQEGRLNVEFHPAAPTVRRKDALVRS